MNLKETIDNLTQKQKKLIVLSLIAVASASSVYFYTQYKAEQERQEQLKKMEQAYKNLAEQERQAKIEREKRAQELRDHSSKNTNPYPQNFN